jgi:hypothetical protein
MKALIQDHNIEIIIYQLLINLNIMYLLVK